MRNAAGEDCLWEHDPQADARLDSLQTILNCASVQGCERCVPCSERALDLFRKVAREHAAQG